MPNPVRPWQIRAQQEPRSRLYFRIMRQIVLDTETTGLDPKLGHRVIEIGGVELVNRRLTQSHFHTFFNPEREIDAGATNVHGMTWDDLKDKPRFADRAAQFIEFVRGAQLVIHNAPFDIGFLDAELALAGLPPITASCSSVLDTLRLAKELHPGKRNSLNVLCERYQVDNSGRTLHGALLDAELLADVYLAMTRGQESLAISLDNAADGARAVRRAAGERPPLTIASANDAELAAHEAYLEFLDRDSNGKTIWRRIPADWPGGQPPGNGTA
jgi:DNA polymerase III subunit epsilon